LHLFGTLPIWDIAYYLKIDNIINTKSING